MAEYDVLFRFRHRNIFTETITSYLLPGCISVCRKGGAGAEIRVSYRLAERPPSAQSRRGVSPAAEKAIPNTVRITPDGNVLFLTGANMAGKSTFMKSLALAAVPGAYGLPGGC